MHKIYKVSDEYEMWWQYDDKLDYLIEHYLSIKKGCVIYMAWVSSDLDDYTTEELEDLSWEFLAEVKTRRS